MWKPVVGGGRHYLLLMILGGQLDSHVGGSGATRGHCLLGPDLGHSMGSDNGIRKTRVDRWPTSFVESENKHLVSTCSPDLLLYGTTATPQWVSSIQHLCQGLFSEFRRRDKGILTHLNYHIGQLEDFFELMGMSSYCRVPQYPHASRAI